MEKNPGKDKKIQARLKIQIPFLRVMENKLLHITDLLFLLQLRYLLTLKIHKKKQQADQKLSSFPQLSKLK